MSRYLIIRSMPFVDRHGANVPSRRQRDVVRDMRGPRAAAESAAEYYREHYRAANRPDVTIEIESVINSARWDSSEYAHNDPRKPKRQCRCYPIR